jgi:hypothetical protein
MLIVAASLTGCRPKSAISRPPTSIESLCLVGAPIARTFKLPGIDTMRNDRMLKGQELHVDIDAAERIAVAATHEIAGPPLDEDSARLMVTEAGGGILVWWRDRPVVLRFASPDPKAKPEAHDIYALAIPEASHEENRVLYVLSRPAGSATAPRWRAVDTADWEHVCM